MLTKCKYVALFWFREELWLWKFLILNKLGIFQVVVSKLRNFVVSNSFFLWNLNHFLFFFPSFGSLHFRNPFYIRSFFQKNQIYTQQTFLIFQDVFNTSSRRLQRNTFRLPRPLEDVFKTCLQDVLQLCLQDIFKTSSRRLGRQKNVTLKTSSRRPQYLFTKTNVCWDNNTTLYKINTFMKK